MEPSERHETFLTILRRGVAIPAIPLVLDARRKFDQHRQRLLLRYYSAAGVGGLAVGVHSTQFEIRQPNIGLFEPVLALAADEMNRLDRVRKEPLVRIAGVCGNTAQAVAEATLARSLGYYAALLSLAAMREASDDELIHHCRTVGDVLPLLGFYLQPSVGGRVLGHGFWRRFFEIDNVCAVKIAPFHRYRTLDVIRASAESGRDDVALYTGNDDNIVADLLTPFRFKVAGEWVQRRIVGGLLGQWAVWTHRAVELLARCHAIVAAGGDVPADMLRLSAELTDANAAIFDVAHDFAGCIPGIHEVLRRQGLMEGIWCLDERAGLSPGQAQEIERVAAAYPHLADDAFVAAHLEQWQRP